MVMRWVGGWVLGTLVFGLLVVGCGASDLDPDAALEQGAKGGLEDSSLEGAERGSLAAERAGRLGMSGTEGPLEDIHFGYDSVDLDDEARSVLQRNHDWLEANPTAKVEVEGHCDERGTVEYNLALGARRAAAARDYLVTLGVSSGRITSISYGEELALCREETESCWRRNRRGHFVVFGQ